MKNKLNIYLIKENYDETNMFKEPSTLKNKNNIYNDEENKKNENTNYQLYYKEKIPNEPSWVKNFFNTKICDEDGNNIFQSVSPQALLVKRIKINDNTERLFALSFGHGYALLKSSAYEKNFGLKTTLSIIEPTSIKKLDRTDMSNTNLMEYTKFVKEQLLQIGDINDFNINYNTNILTAITGKLEKDDELSETFGTTIYGKDSLVISADIEMKNIDVALEDIYKIYISDKYKEKGFGWIDNIKYVSKDHEKHMTLFNHLIDNFNKYYDEGKIILSAPDIIELQNISYFKYSHNDTKKYDDINIDDLLNIKNSITYDDLRDIRIEAYNINDIKIYNWELSECIYAEILYDNKVYFSHQNGWYEVDTNFVETTNKYYNDIINNKPNSINFIPYKSTFKDENEYNQELSKHIQNAFCLDKDLIKYGSTRSKIELCDVYLSDNPTFIHVKKYKNGSSSISHLVAQAQVAITLLVEDDSFKILAEEKLKKHIGNNYKIPEQKYTVILAIIKNNEELSLPFFSKVLINESYKKIKGSNSQFYVAMIPYE